MIKRVCGFHTRHVPTEQDTWKGEGKVSSRNDWGAMGAQQHYEMNVQGTDP